VTAIAAGVVHSLALKLDGRVIAWGCPTVTTGSASSRLRPPAG
jgi:alpha-tubulin suppressor-like RCC1 family protein